MNPPFSRLMTFMAIWMTSSRWIMEPLITISSAKYVTIIENVHYKEENMLLVDGGDVFLHGFRRIKESWRCLF
ncbi:hypothetical protein ACQKNS_02205 [Peribacillus sp. NPDC094092]|uniref:hypothetical protein n=1 Tax=Peribacillus sp. NPDC094092 TaxID=3390611 RepID=UPI003CFFCE70